MMADGLHADGRSQVRFAGAGAAHEYHVLAFVHEVAAMQLPDRCFVHDALGEVEVTQIPVDREARDALLKAAQ